MSGRLSEIGESEKFDETVIFRYFLLYIIINLLYSRKSISIYHNNVFFFKVDPPTNNKKIRKSVPE